MKWTPLLCGALVALILPQALHAQGGPPPASVRLGTVDHQQLQNRWDVVGRLQEVRRSVVAAEVSGKIIAIEVNEGDSVTGGETVLARIDEVWSKIALARAEAELAATQADEAEAQARLTHAREEYEKLQSLYDTKVAPPREFREMKAAYEAQQARVQATAARVSAASANFELARSEAERLVIVAPFDGVVVRKIAEIGEWAQAGSPVVEIVSRTNIDAVIYVPERFINQIKVNDQIDLHIEALKQDARGQVVAIIPQGATAARTFPVKVRIDDKDGAFKAGMSVVAHVPMGERIEAITVPRSAVQSLARSAQVWLAMPSDDSPMPVAIPVPVKVLFGHGDHYVVQPAESYQGPPLSKGMHVVIEGAERIVMPGQPLAELADPLVEARNTQPHKAD